MSSIRHAQVKNGVRLGDFANYRAYCTRRMRRMRKKVRLQQGTRYRKFEIQASMVTDHRFLELYLVAAERCWAYAMELKDDSENPRAKFHARRKLAKGSQYAKKLENLCKLTATPRTILEAESYAAWFKGTLLVDRSEWKDALIEFVKAKTVYEELGKVGSGAHQELCAERVSEIDHGIRYCLFNLGQADSDSLMKMVSADGEKRGLDSLKSQLSSVLTEMRRKEAQEVTQIQWNGKPIAITNEKTRQAIISANDIALELDQSTTTEQRIQLYDKIFIHFTDATKYIDADLAILEKTNKKRPESEQAQLMMLHDYIVYSRLLKVIDRNLMLAHGLVQKLHDSEEGHSKAVAPRTDEIARVYELLIANLTELMTLLPEQDTEVAKDFAAQLQAYKAIRCYYVASSYAADEQYLNAFSLFKRCEQLIASALDHVRASSHVNTGLVDQLSSMHHRCSARRSLLSARALLGPNNDLQEDQALNTKLGTDDDVNSAYLLEILDEYRVANSLIEFPPRYEVLELPPYADSFANFTYCLIY